MSEASPMVIYARVYRTLTTRWQETTSFREVARLGLPAAEAALVRSNHGLAQDIALGTEYDSLFLSKEGFFAFVGGPAGMAKSMTAGQVSSFRTAIDAASLVFMHSALDAAVSDLCEAVALSAPQDWDVFVGERRVTMSRVKEAAYEELRGDELRKHLDALSKESLIKRVDRLYALCRPEAGLELIAGYVFDRDRLVAVDETRHDIIHGVGTNTAVSGVEPLLEFIFRTGLHLFALVNWRYDLKLDVGLYFELAPKRSGGDGSSSSAL